MAWQIIQGPLAVHIAPVGDIRPHEYTKPCWCGARLDHPHSHNVIHCSFLPGNSEDETNPDPPMTQQ